MLEKACCYNSNSQQSDLILRKYNKLNRKRKTTREINASITADTQIF